MERIYLSYTGKKTEKGRVRVNVFLKEFPKEHRESLKSFLLNQKIVVNEIPPEVRNNYAVELSYYDDIFEIAYAPARWSFFNMRDYIHAFLTSWDADLSFASKYLKEYDSDNLKKIFTDSFYVDLSKAIDKCEDNYYCCNNSISIFLKGILKILKDNLNLYFASAVLQNIYTEKIEYMNYIPETIPQKDIIHSHQIENNDEVKKYPVIFNNEHIADFFVKVSPDSPSFEVIDKFLSFVIEMIDDFIFGDLFFRKETFKLNSRIAKLEQSLNSGKDFNNFSDTEEFEDIVMDGGRGELEFDKSSARLIVIGDAGYLKEGKIMSIFKKEGYDKKRVELLIEYDKMKSLDMNNLKKIRSRYDGIILGPMPHKMHGDMSGGSLIGMMENSPEDYPPFVVAREKSGNLKLSNNSLRDALKDLGNTLMKVNSYEE